jgi:hypothetical protein
MGSQMTMGPEGASGADRSRAALLRDAALSRIRRTRRWVIVGTAALTAGFAALVASVAPGRSLASKPSSTGSGVATTASATGSSSQGALPSLPAPASAGELGLQGPKQAPSPAPSQPQQSQPSQPSQTQPSPSQPSQPPSAPAPQPSGPVVSGGS